MWFFVIVLGLFGVLVLVYHFLVRGANQTASLYFKAGAAFKLVVKYATKSWNYALKRTAVTFNLNAFKFITSILWSKAVF